jgi:hypothetical protein
MRSVTRQCDRVIASLAQKKTQPDAGLKPSADGLPGSKQGVLIHPLATVIRAGKRTMKRV